MPGHSAGGYRGKRSLDVTLSVVALVVLAPLMLVVAVAVAVTIGRPVIFTQQRPGRDTQPFSLHKFRTMRIGCDPTGAPLPDSQRLTRLGRFLRATSLDELPELADVLRGKMSIVGPRPLLDRYVPYYSHRERLRFLVSPGITGLAQVNGRNRLPWDERLAWDSWYVEHSSLALDVRIIMRTIVALFRPANVLVDSAGEGDLTMLRSESAAIPVDGGSR